MDIMEIAEAAAGRGKQRWAFLLITEVFALIVIAYGFLTDLPWPIKNLMAMAVTLFMTGIERISSDLAYQSALIHIHGHNSERDRWFENLTMRFALDDLIKQLASGDKLHFDWTEAMNRAADDIKRYDTDQRIARKYILNSSKLSSEFGFLATIFLCAFSMLARGFGGYGLAWIAKTYAPHFVAAIL